MSNTVKKLFAFFFPPIANCDYCGKPVASSQLVKAFPGHCCSREHAELYNAGSSWDRLKS